MPEVAELRIERNIHLGDNLHDELPQYRLLLVLRNTAIADNNALTQGALKELQGRLPPGWRVSLAKPRAAHAS